MVVKLLAHVVLCFLVLECVQEHLFDISRALFIEKTFAGILSNFSRREQNQPAVLHHDYAKLYMISVFIIPAFTDLRKGLQALTRRYLCIKNRLQIKWIISWLVRLFVAPLTSSFV